LWYFSLVPLLLVSSLDTFLLMLHLFNNLSSHVLLSSKKLSPTHPPGAVSFLFISDLATHYSPPSFSSPLICLTCLLRSTLLAHLSTLFLMFSFGSIIGSPHLLFFWIPSYGSLLSFFFSLLSIPPPPFPQGGLIDHSIKIHAHYPLLYKQHLDPERNLFQHSSSRVDDKLPFISVEGFIALNRKINNISFLNLVELEVDYFGPLVIHIFQSIDCIMVPHQ